MPACGGSAEVCLLAHPLDTCCAAAQVLINAGQANAATGREGDQVTNVVLMVMSSAARTALTHAIAAAYTLSVTWQLPLTVVAPAAPQNCRASADAVAEALGISSDEVLIGEVQIHGPQSCRDQGLQTEGTPDTLSPAQGNEHCRVQMPQRSQLIRGTCTSRLAVQAAFRHAVEDTQAEHVNSLTSNLHHSQAYHTTAIDVSKVWRPCSAAESTGVIGRQLAMEALLQGVPQLANTLEAGPEAAHHAAVAITTTDLVSKSAALEVRGAPTPSKESSCDVKAHMRRRARPR